MLELLNRTGTTIAAKLDLRALLQSITDAATQLSGARFGAFFEKSTDERGDAFSIHALSSETIVAGEKFWQQYATTIFNATFNGETSVRCEDVLGDPRYRALEPNHDKTPNYLPVRSYLAVPVTSRFGEVIGGLCFGHPNCGMFTERTEQLVVGVAAQAAVAIDNARLYETAKKAAEERRQLLDSIALRVAKPNAW
jgi:GAF domain-containing protein